MSLRLRILLPVAALTCVAALAGCGGDATDDVGGAAVDSQAAILRGWAAYGERDFSIALVEFERAVNLDGSQADAHNGLGWTRLHLLQGAPSPDVLALSTASFAAALRADGTFSDAWVGMGQSLYMGRADAKALQDAAKALASARGADPATLYRHDYTSDAQLRALEAWCYYYAGEPIAAGSVARAAADLDPNLPAAKALVQLTR
jgi:tetratricopeptide (TPR) repeat protein